MAGMGRGGFCIYSTNEDSTPSELEEVLGRDEML